MQNKRSNKAPSFHMYAGDFLSDMNVRLMSMAQRGMYTTLLLHEWIEGSLPTDIQQLMRLCDNHPEFDSDWSAIKHCFYEKDGRNYNKRLEKERSKMNEYRDRKSNSGKMGAKARWEKKNGTAIAPPSNKEVEVEVEVKSVRRKTKNNYSDEFEKEFWSIYPRRDSKKRAVEKYVSLRKSGVALDTIINGLKSYIKHWRLSGTEPSFIPMASTWLNQERYEDELLSESKTAKKLVLKKNFNWMCDACGHEKTSSAELKVSEQLCKECEEGFYYSKKSVHLEQSIAKAKEKARKKEPKTKTKDSSGKQSGVGASSEKDEFNNQFNNLVNSLGVR
tara:strand:+ start:1937 stop:2935 length:999 start_codon:yes stop_codon:yes gene_type:complete